MANPSGKRHDLCDLKMGERICRRYTGVKFKGENSFKKYDDGYAVIQ